MDHPNWRHARPPTVDDLKTKRCWICLTDETNPQSTEETEASGSAGDRWVHACKCSLVAHESCLLSWIQTAEKDPKTAPKSFSCPQCRFKYGIEGKGTSVLRWTRPVSSALGRIAWALRISLMLSSASAVATAYGGVVVRVVLGREAFPLYFGDNLLDWAGHSLTLALIPIGLGLPGSFLSDIAIPLLAPITYVLTASNKDILWWQTWTLFPPSPSVLIFLWPVVKLFYNTAWNSAAGLVAGRTFRGHEGRLHRLNEILQIEADEANEENAALEEEVEALMAEVQTLVAKSEATVSAINAMVLRRTEARLAENELRERQRELADIQVRLSHQMRVLREAADAAAAAVAAEPPRAENARDLDVATRLRHLGQRLASALLVPFVGHFLGRGLHTWALRPSGMVSGLLRAALGIDLTGRLRSSWTMTNNVHAQRIFTAPSLPSGIQLWMQTWDPVWWRTVLGMIVFVLAKDAVNLFHLWLLTRERQLRRVSSRSFKDVDYASLDLID